MDEYFLAYKQSRRRHDDIAIVNAAFGVKIQNHSITDASLNVGGMAPYTIMATKAAQGLVGKFWYGSLLDTICSLLLKELTLDPGAPDGMIQYRQSWC